jgi:amino acid transporter
MDANEAMDRGAHAYLVFIDRHRAVAYPLIIAGAAGTFLLLWQSLGLAVAIVVLGLVVVYAVTMGVVATVRVRRLRRGR